MFSSRLFVSVFAFPLVFIVAFHFRARPNNQVLGHAEVRLTLVEPDIQSPEFCLLTCVPDSTTRKEKKRKRPNLGSKIWFCVAKDREKKQTDIISLRSMTHD
ncbi:hypothetical protein TMatcc_004182 [Talaromyces marneffei ATCC 18224]